MKFKLLAYLVAIARADKRSSRSCAVALNKVPYNANDYSEAYK